ncbi:MAG: nitroreductase [Clostridia bacterium]|nr:nitroreductase [Clostridia bacterium]
MQEKWDLVRCRHSVRQFREKSIPQEVRDELDAFARQCSIAGELSIQIIYDEPRCFNSRKAHYGKFRNCSNYIALVGKNGEDLEERCGYYGEQVVLKAQELGLNTCWAALTHGKSEAIVAEDETEVILIALGYGQTQGRSRKSKSFSQVSDNTTNLPDWYIRGIRSALCAPTAMNQQKFKFSLNGDRVSVRTGRFGPCLRIDLGIVKYHFELLAGPENFTWA